MINRFWIAAAMLLTLSVTALAEDGDGGYAGSFMQIPIGARAAGMGGAYISIASDGSGILYNPAGLSNLQRKLFSSSYRAMDLDRTLGYAAFVMPTMKNSALGFSWLYGGSGAVDARNTDGDLLGFDLSQHNHAFSAIFAKRFEDFLSAGFRASYLHTAFAEMTAYAVSFDLGVILHANYLFDRERRDLMPIQDIQAALVVRNMAATYRWTSEKYFEQHSSDPLGTEQDDRVPIEVGLGSSARFFNKKLIIATDLVKNEKQGFVFNGGGEYFIRKQFALRGGLSDTRLTAGAGFVFDFKKFGLAIDYAFSGDKVEEGSEHIFSFDLLF